MQIALREGGVPGMLAAALREGQVALAWLGQAGFAIRFAGDLVLIDPYLSDSLAEKYRGKEFPHERMMPAPIRAEELRGVSAVLCTHRHSDHMDPGTLPVLARVSPSCRFVVPRAEVESALKAGVPEAQIVAASALSPLVLGDLRIDPIPAAHEELKVDANGEHHFLGYVLETCAGRIYHSGDCVPYPGLAASLRERHVALAILPVNGRDESRRSRGVPGNFTFAEAAALCREAGIGTLICCHFGMFSFNTADPRDLARQAALVTDLRCLIPDTIHWMEVLR